MLVPLLVFFTSTFIDLTSESKNLLKGPVQIAAYDLHSNSSSDIGPTTTALITVAVIGIQTFALYEFGQPPICKCGYVKLWHGSVLDDQNSQHLTDWYTSSHILHGFILYEVLAFAVPNVQIEQRFLISVAMESGWEIVENSPFIIDRYRHTTLAQGYSGDSILNSVSDTVAMVVGFWMAHILPLSTVVSLSIAEELIVGTEIRDNLVLNVIQLIYPVDSISKWQAEMHEFRQ